MHWQRRLGGEFGETRLYRFAGATAAVVAWAVLAGAGWSWIQLVERLLELPALGGAVLEWSNELLTPDGIARRMLLRTMRG